MDYIVELFVCEDEVCDRDHVTKTKTFTLMSYIQTFQLINKGLFHCLLQYLEPFLSKRNIPHCTKTFKEKLEEVNSKISMTFDSQTSELDVPFLSITAHYIDSPVGKPQEQKLKSEQLAFTTINGNHGGSNIVRILIKAIDDYGIHNKMGWFMANNTTNNNTAIQTIAKAIDPSGIKWVTGEHHMH